MLAVDEPGDRVDILGVERITAVSVTRSQVASTLPSSTALTVPTFVSASSGASSGASESYCTVSVMPEVSQLSGSRTEILSFARTTTLSRPSAYSTCGMSTRAVSASTCTLLRWLKPYSNSRFVSVKRWSVSVPSSFCSVSQPQTTLRKCSEPLSAVEMRQPPAGVVKPVLMPRALS